VTGYLGDIVRSLLQDAVAKGRIKEIVCSSPSPDGRQGLCGRLRKIEPLDDAFSGPNLFVTTPFFFPLLMEVRWVCWAMIGRRIKRRLLMQEPGIKASETRQNLP